MSNYIFVAIMSHYLLLTENFCMATMLFYILQEVSEQKLHIFKKYVIII
jgi:hypothetical protein